MPPRTLGQQTEREARRQRVREPHVEPLNAWADGLRTGGREVPYFDPADGGVNARALFLLESPGPRVSDTGFISMDNPDGTAANMHALIAESGLGRADLALWNVVPWQLSRESVVPPNAGHHREALPSTRELLTLLPKLEVVVLVGRHAERAWRGMGESLQTFYMPHPSPRNFNSRPQAREDARKTLQQVRQLLDSEQ